MKSERRSWLIRFSARSQSIFARTVASMPNGSPALTSPIPISLLISRNLRMCRRLKQDKVHHLMPSKLQRRTLRLKSGTITKIEEGSTADSLKFDPRVAFVTVGGISAAQHHHQGQGDNRPDTQGEWFCDVLVRQEPQHAIVRDKSGRSIRPMAGGAALPVVEPRLLERLSQRVLNMRGSGTCHERTLRRLSVRLSCNPSLLQLIVDEGGRRTIQAGAFRALRSGRGRPCLRARLRCGPWARQLRAFPCRGREPRPSA